MKKAIGWCLLSVLAFAVCYPILFLLSGSFMDAAELKSSIGPVLTGRKGFVVWHLVPFYPSIRAYVELMLDSPQFFHMFWNSTKMVAAILLGQLLLGVPAAWSFAKLHIPFRKLLFTIYIILMMMPFQVTMLSSFLILDKMTLVDTGMAVVFPAVFSTFPVFIMHRFFCGVPDAIIESARIDGARDIEIFVFIGLPLGAAGIVSALVLSFLENWNLIEQPLTFLQTKALWPLSLYLPNISLERAGMAFAASVVTLIPALLIFLSGQDYLEQGIVAAAIKE